jgi:hypothetical protein
MSCDGGAEGEWGGTPYLMSFGLVPMLWEYVKTPGCHPERSAVADEGS